jgi:RNA-binding protein YhbY
MEKLDYALGKLSIATRAKLELVEVRGEVVIIHKQRVFLAIVCHCISN